MTIQIVVGLDDLVAKWVKLRLPVDDFGLCTAIGFAEGETLLCGIVYNNYRPHMIEASIAADSPRWANRRTLYAAFAYPFIDLKVNRLQVTAPKRNKHTRRFNERLGFKFEGIARQALPGGRDAAVYSMLPAECKWIMPHGKRQP